MKKPLVLWGGVDICPSMYNKPRLKYTQHPNDERDRKEKYLVENTIKENRPIIGICRGAQLLCALNGGELYQHSEPTTQCHSIMTRKGLFENVTAGHHQIMMPKGNHTVYGWNPKFTRVWLYNDVSFMEQGLPEVVWWPETKCLAIQPHPEWAEEGNAFVEWLNTLIQSKHIDYKF